MVLSEFWDALEEVYGSSLGRSLISDLYLVALHATAQEALQRGDAPELVWKALVEETGRGEKALWVYRRPQKRNR